MAGYLQELLELRTQHSVHLKVGRLCPTPLAVQLPDKTVEGRAVCKIKFFSKPLICGLEDISPALTLPPFPHTAYLKQ